MPTTRNNTKVIGTRDIIAMSPTTVPENAGVHKSHGSLAARAALSGASGADARRRMRLASEGEGQASALDATARPLSARRRAPGSRRIQTRLGACADDFRPPGGSPRGSAWVAASQPPRARTTRVRARSRGFAPAFDDASTLVVDDDSLPVADGDELADVVRDVFAELDPALRRALAPSLRRTRGKRLGDDYDESDAELIGKGAFSVVYLVRHRRTGGSFAAKIISTEGVTPERRREHIRALLCEAGVAAAAAHDTIVAFRDLFFEPDRAILVQEYCHGGTLLRTVQRKVDRKRSERRLAGARAVGEIRRERSRLRLGGVGADPGGADPYPTTPEEENAEAAAAAAVMAASGGALRERDVVVAVRPPPRRSRISTPSGTSPRRQTRKSSPRRPG